MLNNSLRAFEQSSAGFSDWVQPDQTNVRGNSQVHFFPQARETFFLLTGEQSYLRGFYRQPGEPHNESL